MPEATDKNLVGVGLYTPAEAALYARVQTQTLSRWIHGNIHGGSVVHAQFQDDPDRIVTFLDFVQALAIREIRRDHRIPLAKIRDAVEHARKKYGVEYPYAMPHNTFLFGTEIVLELKDENAEGDELPLRAQISGGQKDQLLLHKVAQLYAKKLTFDRNRLATEYEAFGDDNRKIIMNPQTRFGQPILTPCGCAALSLYEAYLSEGTIERAADAYGVEQGDVETAVRYFDYLKGPVAA